MLPLEYVVLISFITINLCGAADLPRGKPIKLPIELPLVYQKNFQDGEVPDFTTGIAAEPQSHQEDDLIINNDSNEYVSSGEEYEEYSHIPNYDIKSEEHEADASFQSNETDNETNDVIKPICPAGKSLHSAADIEVLVDYICKKMDIDNFGQHLHAVEENAEKLSKDATEFLKWYEDQPDRLLYVLKSLKEKREYIENESQRLTKYFDEIPQLEEKYESLEGELLKIGEKYERYSKVCSINCPSKFNEFGLLRVRDIRLKSNEYYCSSIEDLHEEIVNKLGKYVSDFETELETEITEKYSEYNVKLDNLKHNLQESGIKEFGKLMYLILNFQDEYYKMENSIASMDFETILSDIDDINLEINHKMILLSKTIDKYGRYCKICSDNKGLSRLLRGNDLRKVNDQDSNKNIVDEAVINKIKEIKQTTDLEIQKYYGKLDKILNKEGSYIENHQEIKKQLDQATDSELAFLETLKTLPIDSSMSSLVALKEKYSLFLENIIQLHNNVSNYLA